MLPSPLRLFFHAAGLFAIYQLILCLGYDRHEGLYGTLGGCNITTAFLHQTLEIFDSVSSLVPFIRDVSPTAILILFVAIVYGIFIVRLEANNLARNM